MNHKILIGILVAIEQLAMPIAAQNITDLSVQDMESQESITDLVDVPINPSIFSHPERIKYDSRCFQIEGKDTYIYSGTFHYFRVAKPQWRDRFEKIRAAGFNCVETYVPWNWHEREMPVSLDDYSKIQRIIKH